MGRIIGLSGSQGTGKSTILQWAQDDGYYVHKKGLSRTAQQMLGWDNLYTVKDSLENIFKLQDLVLDLLIKRDYSLSLVNDNVLVERTPADLWAYTWLWLQPYEPELYEPWFYEYQEKLVEQSKIYDTLLLVPIVDEIPFVYDPQRANVDSRQEVQDYIFSFANLHFKNVKVLNNLEQRGNDTIKELE